MDLKETIKKNTTERQRKFLRGFINPRVHLFIFYIFLQSFNIPWRIKNNFWKKDHSPLFVNFPLKSTEEVYRYYLMASQKFGCTGVVLKTDLFNEAESLPRKGGILGSLGAKYKYGIEIDKDVKIKAEKNLSGISCNLSVGDIKKLPYENKKFDTILDLSTIDHVDPEDLERVFNEYARVMKDGGTLFLVVWTSGDNILPKTINHSNIFFKQYFFERNHFLKKLKKNFVVEREDVVFIGAFNEKLIRFVCKENKI